MSRGILVDEELSSRPFGITGRRKKILVVDDSRMILGFTEKVLCGAGYDVITRDTPFGVSSTVLREKPDLVLLDLNMPGLAGDRIVEILRGNRRTATTLILIYSDQPVSILTARAAACGANGFVLKSNDAGGLLAQVVSVLQNAVTE